MKKLSAKGQKWLKGFHIFFACLWVGAAVCLALMNIFLKTDDGNVLHGINLSMKFIDDFIIIPGAMGSLLTGLIYSIFTGWGWFKQNWIIIKWMINIFGIIFGTFWLGQWVNGLIPISETQGIGALSNQTFMHNKNMVLIWGTFQLCTLIFAVLISILKPWRKTKR